MMKEQAEARTLRVAAVQVVSQPGRMEANRSHALPFIETAVAQGAELVVLPELFACGYIPNATIWNYGEPLDGPTVNWLRQTAGRLGIYLGAGFVEVDGSDFYNSFVLAGPDGKLAGCARKTKAETYCFRYGQGRHLIETAIGKIGVGICADNHYTPFPTLMQRRQVDLLLMPHASPAPYKAAKYISEADICRSRENSLAFPPLWARLLGVPVLFVNAVGDLQPMTGLLGRFVDPSLFRLEGLSRIVDSDGALLAELGESEGVIVATVALDPARKQHHQPPDYGGWLHPGSALSRKVMIPLDTALGRAAYTLSRQRRRQAMKRGRR
jgi:N-carbamoylputrescine amidase